MSAARLTVLSGAVLAAVALTGGACGTAPDRGVTVARDLPYAATAELDVYRTEGRTDQPVIVTVHGCCGTRENLSPLALALAESGTVVFNATWRGTDSSASGYPGAYEEVACAVRSARAMAPTYGGDPRRVTLVGWSDGALVGGVVANAGDDFTGGCPTAGAGAVPDAFVALGGFLGWAPSPDGRVEAAYVNDRTVRYFGGTPQDAPGSWAAGNPYTHLGRNERLQVRLVVGRDDPLLVDGRCFSRAAAIAGHPVSLSVAEGGHQTVLAPRMPEGALAVAEILSAARGEAPVPLPAPAPDAPDAAGACPGSGGGP